LATRIVLLQAGFAAGVSLMFLFAGMASAKAALAGGLIVAVGNAILGWRMFAGGVAPPPRLLFAMMAGELMRLVWLAGAIGFAFAVARLEPLPLLAGVFAAFVAQGLGSWWFR
jgi:F0F1-type ATP synthase assembly protein I